MVPAGQARLFSAVLLPDEVVASLQSELDRHPRGAGARRLRWIEAAQWHVTLGFYGLDDPQSRAGWLEQRVTGLPAPTLTLAGGGTFPGVLWTGVLGSGLTELAGAVWPEQDDREFQGHVTLARGDRPQALAAWARLLAEYRSPEWLAADAVLMRSDPKPTGPVYTTVERFRLG
ncbi:RNA 2',3'-cyclic phosphodiesterase [Saccharomonospora sp. NPDC046836]|uniref:RNA 2',3'-cyclic phosphodiesterase n=1 Tax=Saccharomonospora sp. NPDC046836 TaxID=3156921 RepID=UPI0033D85403